MHKAAIRQLKIHTRGERSFFRHFNKNPGIIIPVQIAAFSRAIVTGFAGPVVFVLEIQGSGPLFSEATLDPGP
jgi:hypothetical protein